MASLGERIRLLREENEMTGEQLGKKLNVSKQSISKWENGTSSPDIETIRKIAFIFKTTVDFISGNSDIRNPYKEAPEQKSNEDIDLWLSKTDGYKELPEEDRELISNLAKNLLEKHRKEK